MKKLLYRSLPWLLLASVLLGVPLGVLGFQARRLGLPLPDLLRRLAGRAWTAHGGIPSAGGIPPSGTASPADRAGAALRFAPHAIGDPTGEPPRIGSLTLLDLDGDSRTDVLGCDMLANRVVWLRQAEPGRFVEQPLGEPIRAPARLGPADLDGDGDLDLAVASMGMLFPNNDRIGAVIALEQEGSQQFRQRVLLADVARVTDVRAGDLDGDGDLDLVAGHFGYDDGEIRWLENQGGWRFRSTVLLGISGTIHAIPHDMEGDGDLDIVALVSQEWEEVYLFENDGRGRFRTRLIYGSTNDDFGSSGLDVVDLDRDGDPDLLFTNGDAFDYIPPRPKPWHGVQWLENKGEYRFDYRRIGDLPGATVARALDLDGDGDLDVLAVSAYNFWEQPAAQSMVWFEQRQRGFVRHDLARSPTHLIALEVGDVDGDG
ncbi:MAG: VCBS repeat-containing protein, partial [Deltaproteobacteria bacterium]|nr:VCBS repeat-containing protein [Deltaproteobacteria bacterium]